LITWGNFQGVKGKELRQPSLSLNKKEKKKNAKQAPKKRKHSTENESEGRMQIEMYHRTVVQK
jgi:hypothetical protein